VSGFALERCDYTRASGTLQFAANETEKSFVVLVNDDSYAEGTEITSLKLSNPGAGATLGAQAAATLQITDDVPESVDNPVDDGGPFVRQHYHDFLNRQGDSGGQDYWTLKRVYEIFPLLAPLKQRMAGHLSGGEQQMLTIARTLMGNPIGLLLDEPSEGLAPVIVERIGELLRRLRDRGVTVLLAEQNMHFCLGIASHATIIDKGQIVYRNTIEALRLDDAVKSRYLAL
jgi:ABC-type dipeptide/oligopeptide/nickel transport system ATPase subunit